MTDFVFPDIGRRISERISECLSDHGRDKELEEFRKMAEEGLQEEQAGEDAKHNPSEESQKAGEKKSEEKS